MKKSLTQPVKTEEQAFNLFDRFIREWLEPLALSQWRVKLIWEATEDAFASCEADCKYQKIILRVNPKHFVSKEYSPLHIESVAIHELVHSVVWLGFNELANPKIPAELRSHHEEVTTEHIAQALLMAKYRGAPEVRNLWQQYKVFRTPPVTAEVIG